MPYKRMDVKDKLVMMLLVIVTNSEDLLANKFNYNRQPQISCRYLRHVYRFMWNKPECNPDGSIKNPQCIKANNYMKICCCTYNQPIINKGIKWTGQCATYAAKSKARPVCSGPIMIRKHPDETGSNKVKVAALRSKSREETGEEDRGKVRRNGEQGQHEENEIS